MHYQVLRSVSDNHVHLICPDGGFDALPEQVRKLGPWWAMRRGDIADLKPEYRLRLAREGYAVEKTSLALFKPET